ncbi:hypothetical protein GQ600_20224 [Phytophthora cactorum]|nr:hypothetical protein GQ600_20224 [Phytophthora cactorum]
MDVHWVEYYPNMKTNGVDQSDETKSEDNDDMTGGEKVENQGEEEKMKSQIATYKAVVTGSKDDVWNALKRMGVQHYGFPKTSGADVVSLAANKLLLGPLVNDPSTGCTSATSVVANFMAILAYVNYEKESYLSSYASDPNGLAKYILPQLKKLILDEALDTGGTGEMLVRILFLLARAMLGCDKIPIYRKGMYPADKPGFEAWKPQWKDWHTLGFTHFAQLQVEPNEDTMWYCWDVGCRYSTPQRQ